MAGQALAAKIRRLLGRAGNGMRIVAGAAPQLLSAHSFTYALGEVFSVAGHAQLRFGTRAHEHRQRVRQPVAGVQNWLIFSYLRNTDFAGKVALLTNTIACGGTELRRIYHRLAGGDVIASRAVASLASYASLRKGRRGIGVLRARDPPNPAGVTLEASLQDGPRQIRVVELSYAGCGLPRTQTAKVGDGCFIQESVDVDDIAARGGPASNEVVQRTASLNGLGRALLPEPEVVTARVTPHGVGERAARIAKLRSVELLLGLGCSDAPAALSHLRSHEAAINGCVTRGAGLAPYGFRAVGAERNRKQQDGYKAQQVECITGCGELYQRLAGTG